MYNGVGIANVAARTVEIGAEGGDTIEMVGWFACNGLVSTPNLLNRFIRGETSSGNVGGNDDAVVIQHNHGASSGNQTVSHTHTIGNQTVSHSHVINNAGAHAHDIREIQSHALTGSGWTSTTAGGSLRGSIIQSGGDHGHTSGNQSAAHSHTPGSQSASHSHGITVNNEGESGTWRNRPLYYSVIYITRMS